MNQDDYQRRIIEVLVRLDSGLDQIIRKQAPEKVVASISINPKNNTPFDGGHLVVANFMITMHKILWPERHSFNSLRDICTGNYTGADLELYGELQKILDIDLEQYRGQ